MERRLAAWATLAVLCGAAWADLDTRPAARVHVRYVDGIPTRFTSKLSRVVELNFTLNFNHMEGKAAIDFLLHRIASDYALGPDSAFTVKKFQGPGNGAGNGLPLTPFSLEDLQAADVIVNNNISNFTDFQTKSPAMASAFETAVRGGKSVLSFHGTEQSDRGWSFYLKEFFPLQWLGHGIQTPVPVYRNEAERNHIVLEGVLADSTRPMEVPMGTDETGQEILRPDVPARLIKNENDRYAVNVLSDAGIAPLTTCLLRYDSRSIGTGDLPNQNRFRGGHAYSFILKVGQGRSAYLPCGHDNSHLASGSTSFDGGQGDLERYYAQMLFFLAGYRAEPCGMEVDCEGLPVADASDRLTGKRYSIGSALLEARDDAQGPTVRFASGKAYHAVVTDVRGRVVWVRSGRGGDGLKMDRAGWAPGLYFLRVRIENSTPQVERFLVPPAGR